MSEFKKDLEVLINKNSKENGSNIQDVVLAEYLIDCLNAFEKAVAKQSKLHEYPPVWECPRCGKVNAPFVGTCSCHLANVIYPFTK